MTDQTGRITDLWVGSWIAALVVGVMIWGLMLWCVAAYRKRKGDDTGSPCSCGTTCRSRSCTRSCRSSWSGCSSTTPPATRRRSPTRPPRPTCTCRSSASSGAGTSTTSTTTSYDSGVSTRQDVGSAGTGVLEDQLPTLYLPVDERVEFTLDSRDVIHSFWIPAFLFKHGHDPGQDEHVPGHADRGGRRTRASAPSSAASTTRRCCSTSRSCPREEYDAHMAELKAAKGQDGLARHRVQPPARTWTRRTERRGG